MSKVQKLLQCHQISSKFREDSSAPQKAATRKSVTTRQPTKLCHKVANLLQSSRESSKTLRPFNETLWIRPNCKNSKTLRRIGSLRSFLQTLPHYLQMCRGMRVLRDLGRKSLMIQNIRLKICSSLESTSQVKQELKRRKLSCKDYLKKSSEGFK